MSIFLEVKAGDFVVVDENSFSSPPVHSNLWIGQVLYIVGGARNPSLNSIFQVANIDTGHIKNINADLVVAILKKK